jgi:MFS family permease
MQPFTLYLVLEFSAALLFSLIFTVNSLYQVTVVQLSPLQLVLVGTILEATVFLFEVPTGVLADVKSRRLSIVVGHLLVDTRGARPMAQALMLNAGLIVAALAAFGLARNFWLALALYWLIGALRSVGTPLHAAWFNLRIDDPQVRATIFSVSGQADAIGQIAGGPVVGAIGNASIRAALFVSALLLSPVLPLYARAIRRGEVGPRVAPGG